MDRWRVTGLVGAVLGGLVFGLVIGVFAGRKFDRRPVLESPQPSVSPGSHAPAGVPKTASTGEPVAPPSAAHAARTATTSTSITVASQDSTSLLARTRQLLDAGVFQEETQVVFAEILKTAELRDYPKMLALLNERQFDRNSWTLRSALLHRWAEKDPKGALAAAQAGPQNMRRNAVSAVVEAWSVADSSAALAWVLAETTGRERDQLVGQVASGLARTDPPGAYKILQDNLSGNANVYQFGAILGRWAETDPAAAAEAALEMSKTANPRYGRGGYTYYALLGKWVEKDADAAIQWVASMEGGQLRDGAQQMLCRALARVDPRRAIAMAEKEPSRAARERMLSSTLTQWMGTDFSAAKNWLDTVEDERLHSRLLKNAAYAWLNEDAAEFAEIVGELPAGDDKRDLLRRLGSDWPNRDMDAFLKWFGTVKSDSDQEIVVKAAAQALSWRDPTKAVAFYDILPKGADKYGLASSLLRGWVRTDVESALDWFDTLPVEAQRTAMRGAGMVSALAKKDPERGLEFALEFESGALRSQALGEALGGWADSDLEAAVKWVRDEAGDEDLVSAVNAVMRKLAIEDPPRAATFALMLSEEERGKADASAAANWARSDYRAMLEWATAQTDREIGPYVKAGIAKWAAQDPAAAATALSTMPESNGTQSATQSVVRQWSRTDPDQAADWIVSFPEGSMRDTSVSTLVRNWTESNEEQAETFVSGLQDPHTRDKAALAFIQSIAKYDREKAATWLETIADEDIRTQAAKFLK